MMTCTKELAGELTVIPSSDEQHWDRAVAAALQSDIYHQCRFHRIAEFHEEGEARLFHYRQGAYSICVPLLIRPLKGFDNADASPAANGAYCDATSVYGYAGPLASHRDVPAPVQRAFQSAMHDALQEQRVVCVFSRLHPLIPQRNLLTGMGQYVEVGPTVSIDLRQPLDEQRSHYCTNHKRNISRLRKRGFTVHHDSSLRFLDDFLLLYYETMRRRSATAEYFFPPRYFESLLSSKSDESARLFVCLHEEAPACALLCTVHDGVVQYHLGGTSNRYVSFSPSKLVVDEVRMWATANGYHTFHLGGGLGANEDSLFQFKRGFSPRLHTFSVWKWVLEQSVYDDLCEWKARQNELQGLETASAGYFPLYRAPCKPTAGVCLPDPA